MLLPREPATGALRIVTALYVGLMTALSISILVFGLFGQGTEPTIGNRLVLLFAAVVMIGWAVFLWFKYRPARTEPSA